jgi:hypothetical protein
MRRYDRIEGCRDVALEVDVAGGERMLVHPQDGRLVLVDLGKHEIVAHYQRTGNLQAETRRLATPPASFVDEVPPGFFTFDIESEWRDYANEADPAWLSYLDEQQGAVANAVLTAIRRCAADARAWHMALLMGGPGTGKTSILLNLVSRCIELDIVPQVVVSDEVAEYIEAATHIGLDTFRTTLAAAKYRQDGDVLFVDDPDQLGDINDAKWFAQQRKYRTVVVGVDPLQMQGTPTTISCGWQADRPASRCTL